ncbi:MAG: DUF4231 domain-containing protein [Dermatophilaceae bacterium]
MKFTPPAFDGWQSTTAEGFADAGEAYVLRVRDFYDARARWHRRFYRLSGVLLIVLGGALPLLASSSWQSKDALVAATGFVVATLTGLRGFYRWDASWVLLRGTEVALTRRYLAWKSQQDTQATPQQRRTAVAALLADLMDIREDEATVFFKDLPIVGPRPSGSNAATGPTL